MKFSHRAFSLSDGRRQRKKKSKPQRHPVTLKAMGLKQRNFWKTPSGMLAKTVPDIVVN